jgi:hypothetical protein
MKALALCLLLCACAAPPPRKTLTVRNLQSKCALIQFSGCASLAPRAP